MRTPQHYYNKPYTFLKPQAHKTVSISWLQLLPVANASVTSSQIPTTLLLADLPAEMRFGALGELFLLWHCRYQLNQSSL